MIQSKWRGFREQEFSGNFRIAKFELGCNTDIHRWGPRPAPSTPGHMLSRPPSPPHAPAKYGVCILWTGHGQKSIPFL